VRKLPVGPLVDPLVDRFSAQIPPMAAVYYGIAKRAFDLAVANVKSRTSTLLQGKTYAHHGCAAGCDRLDLGITQPDCDRRGGGRRSRGGVASKAACRESGMPSTTPGASSISPPTSLAPRLPEERTRGDLAP